MPETITPRQPRRAFANDRSDFTLDAICQALELGVPIQDALNIAEMTMSAFTAWVQEDPHVIEVLSRSESLHIQEACKRISDTMNGKASLSAQPFEAAKFVLTKRRRKVFGDGLGGIAAENALLERPAEELTSEARRSKLRELLGGSDPEEAIAVEPVAQLTAPSPTVPIRTGRRCVRVAQPQPKTATVDDILPFGAGVRQ